MVAESLNEYRTAELLAQCEEKIGELYRQYAGLFSEEADFWSRLARDEVGHARWVRSLLPRVKAGQVVFREERLGSWAFILFYDYLTQRLSEVRAHPPTLAAALAIAVDIEGTLVEKAFYEVFHSADAEVARVLTLLARSSDAHLQATRERWRHYQR